MFKVNPRSVQEIICPIYIHKSKSANELKNTNNDHMLLKLNCFYILVYYKSIEYCILNKSNRNYKIFYT